MLSAVRRRPVDSVVQLPPHVGHLAHFLLLMGAAFIGLNFLERFDEHARLFFVAAACTSFGLGILIAVGYRFISKTPLRRRYKRSYVYYSETPVTYLALIAFGFVLALIFMAIGLSGFVAVIST